MPQTVIVSGSTGFIGSALVGALNAKGYLVRRLVRGVAAAAAGDIVWDPVRGTLDQRALEGADAVVHLAGEPIGQRWTAAVRRRIRDSRVNGTSLVATALASLSRPPRVFASGSAMGIYGSRADEELDETSATGTDFLANVAREWEEAADRASHPGMRIVKLRTGLVLGARGGALGRLLLPFRLGVGGRVGSGRQWVSWIALVDMVRAIRHVIETDALSGPVNLSAPNPVTNAEMAQTLATVLRRPAIVPLPAVVLRLMFGEMADATLLGSQRMQPRRLLASGFEFSYPTLEAALRYELAR